MSKNILILYYSKSGSVEKMAKHIAIGVEKSNNTAVIRTVPEVSPTCIKTSECIPSSGDIYATAEDFNNCDAVILGSPSYFGNMSSAMKYFIDNSSAMWFKGALVGKPVGFFTSSASMHSGQESTILSMMLPMLHHGMLIVGLPQTLGSINHTTTGGSIYGATHYDGGENQKHNLSADEIIICKELGKRIAIIAEKLAK